MNIPRRVIAACLLLAGIAIVTPASAQTAAPASDPPLELGYQEAVAEVAVDYVTAVAAHEVGTYVTAVAIAEAEAALSYQRRTAQPAPRTAPAQNTVGECTGFAIPDYIIQRESGGNPSARNPSGAYGCSQTMPFHYSSGQCQGLDMYTVDGQRECTWRISNGGTNLDPWAATR